MTEKDKPVRDQIPQLEEYLSALLNALGSAVSKMADTVQAEDGEFIGQDQVFETRKGPVHAHAGIRFGLGGAAHARTAPPPRPVNPDRPKDPPVHAKTWPLRYDVLVQPDGWMITADVPGIRADQVVLSKQDEGLVIETTGERHYHAVVALQGAFSLVSIEQKFRNGILTLQVPRKASA